MSAIPPSVQREWHRYTSGERLARFLIYLSMVAAIVWAVRKVEVIPEFIADAPEQMADMFRRMWPIDWAFYPQGIHTALLDSIHIATLGTVLALILAAPIALMTARNVTRAPWLNWFGSFLLVSTRSINTLVWALFFVAVFGPGALAGCLAIAFHSIGFCGKLLAEALEESNRGSIEALEAAGAPWATILAKGYWPQIKPAFWAIMLFRWDINVRESAVLGLVGAGGVGMVLDTAINQFQWQRVAMILVAILAVVILAEVVVTQVRKRII